MLILLTHKGVGAQCSSYWHIGGRAQCSSYWHTGDGFSAHPTDTQGAGTHPTDTQGGGGSVLILLTYRGVGSVLILLTHRGRVLILLTHRGRILILLTHRGGYSSYWHTGGGLSAHLTWFSSCIWYHWIPFCTYNMIYYDTECMSRIRYWTGSDPIWVRVDNPLSSMCTLSLHQSLSFRVPLGWVFGPILLTLYTT